MSTQKWSYILEVQGLEFIQIYPISLLLTQGSIPENSYQTLHVLHMCVA